MGSAVNFLGGFGPVPAESAPQGLDGAATDGIFAALMAQAAQGVDAAVVAPGPELPEGVIHRVFVAEWCLTVPDEEVSKAPSECATVEENESGTAQEENPDAAGIIVDTAYLDWLRAQPVPPAPVVPPAGPPAGEAQGPSAVGVEAHSNGAPILAAETAAPPQIPVETAKNAQVLDPEQAPELALPEQSPAVRPGAVDVPNELGEPAKPNAVKPAALPPIAHRVDDSAAVPVDVTVTAASQAPAESGADITSAFQAEEPQAEVSARPRAASSQLARAIERSGVTSTAAVVVPPTPENAGYSMTGEGGSSTTAGHEQSVGGGASARATQPLSFAAHVAAEVQRTPAPVVVPVTAPPEAAAASEPDATTTDQIVQAMKFQFRDGIGDAVVRLKPEHLGEVSISLRVEQQTVTATVHADVAAVRAWLESQEGQLRQGLSDQGLHLEKFVVREDESRDQEREAPQPRQQKRRQPGRDAEDAERFEVVV